MKKIGIVGGVAWLSTVDYYTEICRRSERWHVARNLPGVPSTPEMSIESLDHNKAVSYLGIDGDEESWSRFDDYHRTALQRLEASGVDFALMASNTPHDRYASIVRGIGIPVTNIFEAVAKESARMGASEVLILGTATTMRSARFREEFAKYGVVGAGPRDESARATMAELITELQLGRLEGAGDRLGIIVRSRSQRSSRGGRRCVWHARSWRLRLRSRRRWRRLSTMAFCISTVRPCISMQRLISRSEQIEREDGEKLV